MKYMIVGLGNPGEKYEKTRHNVGWQALDFIADGESWEELGKANAMVVPMSFDKHEVWLVKPTTFMNKSGVSVAYLANKHKIKPENIVVIYDELDLPIGERKMTFNRGSGGHRGIDSIIKKLGTKAFLRIRVGVSPKTSSGKIKKPRGEEAVLKFIMGDFRQNEEKLLKGIFKEINEALDVFVLEGRAKAMNLFN